MATQSWFCIEARYTESLPRWPHREGVLVKFRRIQPGQTLYDCHPAAGKLRHICWPVVVESVDREAETAVCRWGNSPPRQMGRAQLERLRQVPVGHVVQA